MIAGPLFVVAFLIQGAARPDYDPLRHSISSLALGAFGWVQSLSFIVSGLLSLAFAAGVRQVLRSRPRATWPKSAAWGTLLLGAWAVHLIGAGLFVTDPDSGYPPGSPIPTPEPTLHNLSAGLGNPALVAACFVFARWFARRGERNWALASTVSGAAVLTSVILASYGFGRTGGIAEIGGLFQRVMGVCAWAWFTALAVHLLNHQSKSQPAVGALRPTPPDAAVRG